MFGLLLSLPIIFVLALLINWGILFYSAILFGFILYNIFYERAFVCVINSDIGMINYHRSGILMSPLDEQKVNTILQASSSWKCSNTTDEEEHIFQIYLRLNDGQRIQLSPSNLSFSECQTYAKKICEFLGSEIPIKAVG